MKVSLVVTTYNWPEALEKVLLSALNQALLPDEIIIADDGSGPDTKLIIEKINRNTQVPVLHCWQEDAGFRAAAIRNKAIAMAHHPYVILIDGDMVLGENFIKSHVNFARKGVFIQGARVITSPETAQDFLAGKVTKLNVFSKGISNRLNAIDLSFMSKLLSMKKKTLKGIKTCNMAFWREDAIAVNGFNEEFVGWGREDSEFVVRLLNFGLQRVNLKFGGVAYHIYHMENSRDSLPENDKRLADAVSENKKWCQDGINKHL